MTLSPLFNRRRTALFCALVIGLASLYMTTYSGRIESGDTLALFDASESLVYFGDTVLDKSAWFSQTDPTDPLTVRPYPIDAEPLQLVLAAPLIWLADKLPGVGLVHTAWLFNILICSLISGVLFACALAFGYSERTAVVFGLLIGATSLLWPYSKTFFREPLAALMILLTALLIARWRAAGWRSLWLAGGTLLALCGAILAKEAVIFALPALALLALPPLRQPRLRRLLPAILWIGLAAVLAFIGITLLVAVVDLGPLYAAAAPLLRRTPEQVRLIHTALQSYLLSIGGSLWGTSPILLLCIPSAWLLYRQARYRLIVVCAVALGSFALGYALFRGDYWFGGLSWPPRFLIPALPLVSLALLPALDEMIHRWRWPARAAFALLIAYSLWVQVTAVSLPWEAYPAALPPEAAGVADWGAGLNVVRYLRWVVIPDLWSRLPLDMAWVRLHLLGWPILSLGMMTAALTLLWRLLAGRQRPRAAAALAAAGVLLLLLTLISLSPDPLYDGANPHLRAALDLIQSQTEPGDVLLLANNNPEPFFSNFAKFRYPRVISLPDPPGEQSNPDEPPRVRSANPDALLIKETVPFLHNLAAGHDQLWLFADTGPWIPFSVRPVERFMVMHYYPLRELSTTPPDARIRLIEYSTVRAPDPFSFRGADDLTDLRFGQEVRLLGFSLPSGTTYSSGAVLPLSLYWQTDSALERDLTVAWFVVNSANAVVVQGADTPPAWGFAPTTGWMPGIPLWDNRALRLPTDLPAGEYRLWLRLYPTDDPTAPLTVSGQTVVEGTIGVLPVTLSIVP